MHTAPFSQGLLASQGLNSQFKPEKENGKAVSVKLMSISLQLLPIMSFIFFITLVKIE